MGTIVPQEDPDLEPEIYRTRSDRCRAWAWEKVKKRVPITRWLPSYRLKHLQHDVIAGLTVGLTVIPQALAYASIAKLPIQYGLYSAFMGCFVYCIFGTSKDITLGPTAIMSLLMGSYSSTNPANPAYAILITLICGCIQIGMALLNLGFVINFLSLPVLSGFTSAAAIIIAFGQLKHIFGITVDAHEFYMQIYETFAALPHIQKFWDLLMGCICLIVLMLLKKIKDIKWNDEEGVEVSVLQKVMRLFLWLIGTARNAVVVIAAASTAYALSTENDSPFKLTGNVTEGLPPFKLPDFQIHDGNQTITTGEMFKTIGSGFAVVPLIAILESVVIAKAFAKQNKYTIDPTQEIFAIGMANVISSFVSSYPITGSFSRTAVNSQSGVKTPAGGVVTGALVLLALGVLSSTFYYIPKSALAAVIISAVVQMVEYHIVLEIWRSKKMDLVPLFVTFLACLFAGIEYGIIAGIGVSVLMLLYPTARPQITIYNKDVIVARPNSGLYFPSAEYFKDKIGDKMSGRRL